MCPSVHTYLHENMNDYAQISVYSIFVRVYCAATPSHHLCVCVGKVVIDYRRPVVRVAVVTRRLCSLL